MSVYTQVHSAASGGGSTTGAVTITSATSGNLLVSFYSQVGMNTPTINDNLAAGGWTINGTNSLFVTNADTGWVAYKVAAGGETSVTWTAGSGGTAEGTNCIEINWSGGALSSLPSLDNSGTVAVKNNQASTATTTTTAVTTTDAGAIVLAAVLMNTGSGTVTAWTANMINFTQTVQANSQTTARAIGGYYIPGTTVSAQTYTANWTTAHPCASMVIAFQTPAASGPTAANDVSMWGQPVSQPSAYYAKSLIIEDN